MSPTVALEADDYKSDECDEQTVTELYYSAFYNRAVVSDPFDPKVRIEEKHVQTNHLEVAVNGSVEIHQPEAEKFISQDTAKPVETEVVASKTERLKKNREAKLKDLKKNLKIERAMKKSPVITLKSDDSGGSDCSMIILDSTGKESDDEGISTKMKSPSKSSGSNGNLLIIESDSDDLDINAVVSRNVKQKKKSKGKPERIEVRPVVREKVIVEVSSGSVESDEIVVAISSDDEISLSSTEENIELNIVSHHRGKADTVKLTPSSTSPEERERLWRVDIEDKYKHINKSRRYHSTIDCRNCRKTGHSVNQCTEPRNIVCFMCGDNTHAAWSCPDKICHTCKRSGHHPSRCYQQSTLQSVQCHLCMKTGHTVDICPDHWRRFHLTTKEGPLVEPDCKSDLQKNRRFCSWCGHKGHFASECKEAKYAGISSRFVHSYAQTDYSSTKNVVIIKQSIENSRRKRQEPFPVDRTEKKGRPSISPAEDFLPLPGPSGGESMAMSKISGFRNGKKRKRLSTFAETVYNRAEKRKKPNPSAGGIKSIPSVKRAKRQEAKNRRCSDETQKRPRPEMNGDKPKNRRKERRKLQRMENRQQDAMKKKKKLKKNQKLSERSRFAR